MSNTESNKIHHRKRRKKMLILVPILFVGVWVLGDFIYSRVTATRLDAWESQQTWTDQGVRVGCETYELSPAIGDSRENSRDAILLIHGINDSPRVYDQMARLWADQGYFVRVVRLPGFGERLAAQESCTTGDWLAAVDRELTALGTQHDRVFAAAHSLGCAILIRHLIEDSDACARIALLAPAIAVSNDRSPILSARMWHQIGNRLLFFTQTTESPFAIDVQDKQASEYKWRCPFVMRRIQDEVFTLLDRNRRESERFDVPTMMVLAAHDQVIDGRAAEAFYETIATSDKQLMRANNSGHSIPLDHDWKQVASAVSKFFSNPLDE